jgi:ABC-2 type transport system permease protein
MSLLHRDGICAVGRRQLSSFLGNPLGYVFILAFVLVSGAVLFWFGEDRFFARNIADLGPLTQGDAMGWLLCVLLPALGMGAWSAERDHGTEEHLLTLPLSPFDALLGKWLAVSVFFTIALACTLSHVIVVAWLGTPDWGLVACNYAGWWLAGLAFAGIAVLASTLVSMPAVAFVIGVVGCAAGMWSLHTWDWFDGFNRGVISLGAVVAALAVAAGALGAATFVLSSRRWRPGSEATVAAQVMSLLCAIVLVANLSRLAARGGIDADATAEGLSSISAASLEAVRGLKQPVTITAFLSKDVPPELALKAKEVEDKLKALGRASPSTVVVQLLRPSDALDDDGVKAEREFNLKPRRQVIDSAAGRHYQDVFLGAAVTSAGRTQVIEHFDPGLSVEYELIRAVRSVSGVKKRVLGIAATDLEITGGFDYRSMGMSQAWEIVEEWKRQYEVRPVALDGEVASDVEVLVVPQPSTLTAPQIERLHDYIWAGRPALLLEDPMPFFQMAQGRGDLIPGQPKRNPAAQFGGQPPEGGGPQKGDLRPLIKALGLEFRPDETVWSDFNPSHYFKELIPANFVWLTADRGAIEPKNAATTGVNALLLPYPGSLTVAADKAASLTVTPLLMPVSGPMWGISFMRELTTQNPYNGQLQINPPDKIRRRPYADQTKRPPFAIEVTGTMPSAYPRLAGGAKPAPAKEGEEAPKPVTGATSAKPVHVIVVADLDLIDNEFFQFYRNAGNRLGQQDELRVLMDLKNVQFVANAVDALFDDKAYLELRTRRPARRPLTRLEAVSLAAQEIRNTQKDAAQDQAQSKIDTLNAEFQASLAKIDAREDLDEDTKAQERSRAQIVGQRKLDAEIQAITLKRQQEERTLSIEQDRAIQRHRWWVKFLAVGIPTAVLALIAIVVFALRLFSERTHIPAARRRQGA